MYKMLLSRRNGEFVRELEFAAEVSHLEAARTLYHTYMGDPNRVLKPEFAEVKPGVYRESYNGMTARVA